MTLTRLWAVLAVGLPVLAGIIAGVPSVDLAYHLRAGALVLDTLTIPRVDTFTFTVAGLPWQDQQWLAQAVLAAIFRVAGWTGLVVLRAILVGIAFGLLFDICRRRAGSIRLAAWLTLGAFACAAISLGLRPQLFGIALFAAVLWLVIERHEHPRAMWLAVPLVLAWSNIHGSFILGTLLLGIAVVEDLLSPVATWRPTVAVLVACLAATLVNPFGVAVWTYAAGISTSSVITGRISEWQPTSLRTPEGALFFGSALAVAAVAVVAAPRTRALLVPLALWLVPFFLIGAWAVRGLAWWPFVAASVVAALSTTSRSTVDSPAGPRVEPPLGRRLNLGIALALVAAGIVALPIWRPTDQDLGAPSGVVGTAPPGITAALRTAVKSGDRVVAPQPWGSWFEFAIPDAPVAVDSRIELFPPAVWDAVDRIETGTPGWKETLADWDVAYVVAAKANAALVGRLTADHWEVIHADEDGTVLRAPSGAMGSDG